MALYAFTEWLGLWYLLSSVCSFIIAFIFNFSMQKWWAFRGEHDKSVKHQLVLFLLVNLGNLVLNSIGLLSLVEYFHLWYMGAQLIMSALLAIGSFFLYSKVVFFETQID